LKERERVVIVDPAGTFFVSPLLQFQEAKQLHAEQSTLAAVAFLERNPKGFDHPDLLKQMFLKHAQEKAHAEWASEESEFKAKELHQKAEIGKIDILQTRSDAVLTQISGQLIRTGIFQERGFSEAVPFVLKLKLLRNPNMVENGRFPTAIQDFKYEPTHYGCCSYFSDRARARERAARPGFSIKRSHGLHHSRFGSACNDSQLPISDCSN
jgi:hypothetical protein